MNSVLEKKRKLGEGAYGIVYEALIKKNKTDEHGHTLALKRNYGDPENLGICCIREMNFLKSLKHKHIIKLLKIIEGDPFTEDCPMTPKHKRDGMLEDSYHFLLEYVDINLEDYYIKNNDHYYMKIIIFQCFLAIDFMHSKKIIHRDLKPANILINTSKKLPEAKICDFGLSTYAANYRPATPGAVTAWYRAPEICCEYDNYSYPIDIWSLGCIFFEIITKKILITGDNDSDIKIFKKIINTIPEKLEINYLNKYILYGYIDPFDHKYKKNTKKKSFKNLITEYITEKDFNKQGGNLEQFSDLLDKILIMNPNKRLTANECLDHNFFDIFKEYKKNILKEYPPIFKSNPKINIIECIERKWACNLALEIYNSNAKLEWYNHYILFHSLQLFDKYIGKKYPLKHLEKKNIFINEDEGYFHNKKEVILIFYTCIYIFYKYFSTLSKITKWQDIYPKYLTKKEYTIQIISYENKLIEELCNYKIFESTLIEYLDINLYNMEEEDKEYRIKYFINNYCKIDTDYKGSVKDLYYQFVEGIGT